MTEDRKQYTREWRAANPDRVKAIKRRYYERHKERLKAKTNERRKKNPELYRAINRRSCRKRWTLYRDKHRLAAIKRRYGMTADEYRALLAEQGEACAICRTPFSEIKRLCVDHCHSSNKVRGVLCDPCNVGLGAYRDRPDLLQAAVEYLLRHQSRLTA